MKTRFLTYMVALGVAIPTMLSVTVPAAAARWYYPGYGYYGYYGYPSVGADIAGAAGTILGGAAALATLPFGSYSGYYYPSYGSYGYPGWNNAYAYAPDYGSGRDAGYCERHFRSYNPSTGMYLGYDGRHHSCP
jgi:hypothetical protein